MNGEGLVDELKRRGYKITKQREAILSVFQSIDKTPMTAHEIFEMVLGTHPGTNFSTVYRNLELLLQEGMITKVEIDRDASYYELTSNGEHHHHLICKKCGDIQKTQFCPYKDILHDNGFVPVDHRFEVYGYCRDCIKHS